MKTRIPRLLLALLLCAALLVPTFALAEDVEDSIDDCPHTSKHPVMDQQATIYKYDDPHVTDPSSQHAVYGEIWQYNECDDCGMWMSGKPVGEENEFLGVEGHWFYDGQCEVCGYVCQHPLISDDWYTMNNTYANIGDAYNHQVSGTSVHYTYCTNCYKHIEQTETPYTELQDHDFWDWETGKYTNVCKECGYTCTHPETTVDIVYSDKVCVNVGNKNRHYVAGTKTVTTRCRLCDQVISEVPVDVSYFEEHDFNEKGVCEKCQYACPHATVRVYTDDDYEDEEPTYKDTGDNKTHQRISKVRQFTVCADCGARIGEPALVTVSETRNHWYWGGNTCEACGHVNTCTHANKEVRLDDDWDDHKYEKLDNAEYHNEIYTYRYSNYCADCGAYLGEADVAPYVETIPQLHDFDRNGVCYGCGYELKCTHANAYDKEYDSYNKTTYEDTGSNETHLCCRDVIMRKYCPDCDRRIGSEQVTVSKVKEPHDWDANGVCRLCAHKNTCAHKRTEKITRFRAAGYTPLDATQHTMNGVNETVLYCVDCGMDLEVLSSVAASKPEDHDFDWEGFCNACGYQKTGDCKHANVIKDFEGGFEDTRCKPIDATKHRRFGNYCIYDLCQDCLEMVNGRRTYVDLVEAHNFDDNGVCVGCGYKRAACEHANLGGWEMSNTGRATYKNIGHKLVHEATPVLSRRVYCEDCGELVEDEIISEGETMLLYHNFDDNGVCKDCGYVSDISACAHANTVENRYFNGMASSFDTGSDVEHMVNGTRMVTELYCKDCGRIISKTIQPYASVMMKHNYRNGVCTSCGHVNKCAHANKETKTTIIGKVKDTGNNKTHLETGYKFETVTCKDCGELLSSKLVSKNASEKIAHTYVDNLCVQCGHVKTAEKAEEAENKAEEAEQAEEAAPAAEEVTLEAVPETTAVNGVKAEDHQPIAEALKIVGDTLDGEGSDVSVEIVGADKILTKEEMTRFNKLPVKDRMMVLLNALGLSDAIDDASKEGMSAEAKALTDDISKRLEEMTEDEKQALLGQIAKFFPQSKVTVDGKEYDAFSIELLVTRDGKEEHDRYTFYNDGTQWLLYGIEVGVPASTTEA